MQRIDLREIPINLVSSRMRENRKKRGSQLLFLFFFCERVLGCNWDLGFLRVFLCTLVFSLIIVKSLQLRGRRQIAEPRKYCLVRVIVFFDVYFLYLFCFSQVGFLVKIPYTLVLHAGLSKIDTLTLTISRRNRSNLTRKNL